LKRVLLIPILLAALSVSSFAEFPASDVYEKTSKVVVLIVGFGEGSNSMIGSGAIVGHHGTIVTNAHVVMNKAASSPYSKIKVYTKPDKVTGSLQEDLKQAFIAKYSPRSGTAAFRLKDTVPLIEKQKREQILLGLIKNE